MSPLVLHVTGARPNFPKAAPVIAALNARGIKQHLVHTGQHYDDRMSEVFFRELGLPRPDVNLGVGSGGHGSQTAAILAAMEVLLLELEPALVMVYGDVNSTIAAALAAVKIGIPVAHVEAGLRSFDRTMPEEINRVLTDQISELLLCTSPEALAHLGAEGVAPERMHFVGNPMIDTLLASLDRFDDQGLVAALGIEGPFGVATIHRPANVDDPATAADMVRLLHGAADRLDIIIPLHPRGRANLEAAGLSSHSRLHVQEPLGYLQFMGVVRRAQVVLTDSGGVQEETTVLRVPCLTMRPNTERPVTITDGTNQLVTADTLLPALDAVLRQGGVGHDRIPPLWDGRAGERVADVVVRWLAARP